MSTFIPLSVNEAVLRVLQISCELKVHKTIEGHLNFKIQKYIE